MAMSLAPPPFYQGKCLREAEQGAAEMSREIDGRSSSQRHQGWSSGSGKDQGRKERGHPPDDLVALVAHGSLAVAATAPAMAPSSGGLHDGGAVLHRRGCGWLGVPGQHRAGLVWGVALSKCRVHSPGWAARGTGGGRACQGQEKWLHGGTRGHHRTVGRARGSLEGPAPHASGGYPPFPKSTRSHQARVPGV